MMSLFAWQSNKAILFYLAQNSVSNIQFSTGAERLNYGAIEGGASVMAILAFSSISSASVELACEGCYVQYFSSHSAHAWPACPMFLHLAYSSSVFISHRKLFLILRGVQKLTEKCAMNCWHR